MIEVKNPNAAHKASLSNPDIGQNLIKQTNFQKIFKRSKNIEENIPKILSDDRNKILPLRRKSSFKMIRTLGEYKGVIGLLKKKNLSGPHMI